MFADALALVLRELWGQLALCMSTEGADLVKGFRWVVR
jgi:hypothetical protein